MTKINNQRRGCIDVFNSFLVCMATYAGIFEFPIIHPCYEIPNRLIPFSKCISSTDVNYWVHFYEDDYLFERIWNSPRKYLQILKRFNGVILPDFSIYRDMPWVMQLWNIYRSRAIGCWLQVNGIKVIPNIRYSDRRTYRCCCDGISKHCTIAVGSHGTLKNREDRFFFTEGLKEVVKRLEPSVIVVYGSCPDSIFQRYKDMDIRIISFESEFAKARR